MCVFYALAVCVQTLTVYMAAKFQEFSQQNCQRNYINIADGERWKQGAVQRKGRKQKTSQAGAWLRVESKKKHSGKIKQDALQLQVECLPSTFVTLIKNSTNKQTKKPYSFRVTALVLEGAIWRSHSAKHMWVQDIWRIYKYELQQPNPRNIIKQLIYIFKYIYIT